MQHMGAGLENDEYVRKIDGYLPTAEVAFIDEIFKANSAILNALLTLLNERLFDNGYQRITVPLLCLVRPWQPLGCACACPGSCVTAAQIELLKVELLCASLHLTIQAATEL